MNWHSVCFHVYLNSVIYMDLVNRLMKITLFAIITLLVWAALPANAQDKNPKVIQFSGVVMEEDSSAGIPGVHVYVPGKRRGTAANYYGYFSFPVLEGDTVLFTAVGYERKQFVIPKIKDDMLTVVVPLKSDTVMLEEVPVMPYPTEEMFKEAILAMNPPTQSNDYQNMQNNLDPAVLSQIYNEMPMDGSMNHTYFMQMQNAAMFDNYGPRSNPLLNPFNWARFIKSLKGNKND